MTEFSTEDGAGSYHAGLITLPDGRQHGIETVTRLAPAHEKPAPVLPDLLGTLRGALPKSGSLSMPFRLAVSTVRAGLGALESELTPASDFVAVEIGLSDAGTIVARMPPDLAAAMARDREVVLAALARAAPAALPPQEPVSDAGEPEGTAEALTSIFRYEKRNGRLRRVGGPDKSE